LLIGPAWIGVGWHGTKQVDQFRSVGIDNEPIGEVGDRVRYFD